MPKRRVASTVVLDDHAPIWDELVTELGDPRPYEPSTIDVTYVVPDHHFLDEKIAYDDACAQLERDAFAAFTTLGDVQRDAFTALDALYPWPEVADLTDDAMSALTRLDAEATQVLPTWPSDVTVIDGTSEDAS